jgi:hypothetical protein
MAMFQNLTGLNRKKAYSTEQLSVTTSAVVTPTADKVDNVLTGTAVMTTTNGGSQGLPPQGGKASAALLTFVSNGVYVTFDGTTPSSSNGVNFTGGDMALIEGYQNVKNLKLIGNGGTCTVNVAYFKE